MQRRFQIGRQEWDVLALILLAAAVYRPWAATSLPILDFSEFLPILRTNASPFSQFAEIARYMATQGRFCPLLYAYLVAAWSAFGMWAPGWYTTYFALNAAILVVAHRFLMLIGVRRIAALLALAIWTVAPPVAAGWLRPTGEPIGLLLMLAALFQAYNYAKSSDWQSRAFLIAALAFGMIAAKEMLVALLPALWLMTRLRHSNGRWTWAPWSHRDVVVTGATTIATALALIPVALVARSAPVGNYAGRYGSIRFTTDALIERLEMVTLPTRALLPKLATLFNDPAWQLWLALPNLLWLFLLLATATIAFHLSRRKNAGGLWPLAVASVWVFAGAVAYVPWPSRATFYMLPFALGVAFAIAHGLSWMLEQRATALPGVLATSFILAISVIEARDLVHEQQLRIGTDRAILEAVAQHGKTLPLLAAVPSPARNGSFGWGRELAEYGRASGILSPSREGDVTCIEGRQRAAMREPVIIVSAMEGCGPVAGGSIIISETVPRHRWPWIFDDRKNRRIAFVIRGGEQLVSQNTK